MSCCAFVQAIMSFDLGNPVGDVAWAPFSSTVFAATTEDGKVYVYDLAQDISSPLCEQLVVKSANLTRVAFNPRYPILLVGDNKCAPTACISILHVVMCLSWSSNSTSR